MTTPDASQFRHDPPRVADERAMYQNWLDFHRGTLVWKCTGLTDAELKSSAVPPSTLTLLGLLRHMAEVERAWFRTRAAGITLPDLYCTVEDTDGDFDNVAAPVSRRPSQRSRPSTWRLMRPSGRCPWTTRSSGEMARSHCGGLTFT